MKWMRERDALIAQTMAFVQSVTGKKPDADKFVAASVTPSSPDPAAASIPGIEALLADTSVTSEAVTSEAVTSEAPKPAQIARIDVKGDFQSEIRARVASFRAHQERFTREREAFGSTTMAKVQASLREVSMPPRPGK
jgi:hypothetical protein